MPNLNPKLTRKQAALIRLTRLLPPLCALCALWFLPPPQSATIPHCTGRGQAAEKHPLNLIRLAPAEGMQTVIRS